MMTLFDLFGSFGVLLIIVSYFLLQMGRLSSQHLAYSLANALGSVFIMISLSHQFNFSAFLIELFWLLISLFGIYKSLKANNRSST